MERAAFEVSLSRISLEERELTDRSAITPDRVNIKRSISSSKCPTIEMARKTKLWCSSLGATHSSEEAVHADASLTQVGERQMSNADRGRLCLYVARSALSLALQALNGTPQSEVTPHTSCFFVRAAGSIEL
ncbi:jg23520 [Pararge aegeria aegeria]|uniref:Jg23520 protein n=1 Tax=Pararge aegeria aegeria TaxID=348720 RepID=A0A8S4QU43_9NEOP|nr:jg23520 [Pararge aegeria aegeria]